MSTCHNTRIAVQGIQGSFSEQAALEFIKRDTLANAVIDYQVNSENVLNSVYTKQCQYGIVALENSTGGVVFETIEALSKYPCKITSYFSILVKQNLLSAGETTLEDILEIHSHEQALRQCKQYLLNHFTHVKQVTTEDTALSAKHLTLGRLPAKAAVIGNKRCAELYGLTLLAENINDLKDNQTLFISLTARK